MFIAVFIVLLFVLACYWVAQFVQLMLLGPADFPGPHDRVLWCIAFLVAFPLAPFAFVLWKNAYSEVRKAQ